MPIKKNALMPKLNTKEQKIAIKLWVWVDKKSKD